MDLNALFGDSSGIVEREPFGEDGVLLISPITSDVLNSYNNAATVKEVIKGVLSVSVDEAKMRKRIATHLVGWENLTRNGEPVEFNEKNRDILVLKGHGVAKKVLSAGLRAAGFQAEEEGQARQD